MERQQFIVSSSPHITSQENIPKIMYGVVLSLLPATLASIFFFGLKALTLILVCILTSLLTEYLFQKGRGKEITAFDGSAIITGLLLALSLPPTLPYFAAILGAVVAIILGKQLFGGLGQNIFNPALVGRAFLAASFPVLMTRWAKPLAWMSSSADAVTQATPLALAKFEGQFTPYIKLVVGNIGGTLGETSALALFLGALYLLYKRYIDWRIPASILGTVAMFGGVFWLLNPVKYPNPLFHILAGGLILGAFFMATDMVTSPVTPKGSWIFGIGVGFLTVIIRLLGGLAEGVMYSILLMNAVTPLINRYTKPRILGEKV